MESLIAQPDVIPAASTGDFSTFTGKPRWSVPKTQLISESTVLSSEGSSTTGFVNMSNMQPQISTGPGPVIPASVMSQLKTKVDQLKALTIGLSVVQVVLVLIPTIGVIMEIRGSSSMGLRIASLVSILLLLAASVVKLAFTADFWAKPSLRDIAPALLA